VSHPETIGINISENTILVLRGSIAEVLGTGGVTIFNTAMNKLDIFV
jgi:cyanophycinase-like exopeptidase